MESSFIELSLINHQSNQLDTIGWFRVDQITRIVRPTTNDLRTRKEIAAIISILGGECYAVKETPQWILEQIEEKFFE